MNNDERETLARVSWETSNLVFSDLPTSCLSLRMATERLRLTCTVKRRATSHAAKAARRNYVEMLETLKGLVLEGRDEGEGGRRRRRRRSEGWRSSIVGSG